MITLIRIVFAATRCDLAPGRYLIAIPLTAVLLLSACGGGGDSSMSNSIDPAGSTSNLPSALDFSSPATFVNDPQFETGQASISIEGGLNSNFIPRGYCPDKSPPQDYYVMWSNTATGQTGRADIWVFCTSNMLYGILLEGIDSHFAVRRLALELGHNRIEFRTYENGSPIGFDSVTIVREDRDPPTVTWTYPRNNVADMPINHPVVVLFNEPTQQADLSMDEFVMRDATGVAVPGQLEYTKEGRVWQFRPDVPLEQNAPFTVTVASTIVDAGGGNSLGTDITWTFTTASSTDISPPTFASGWPGVACDCAPVDTRILVELNEPAEATSVVDGTVTVTDENGAGVPGTVIYRGDHIEFLPTSTLVPGVSYTVTVNPGVRDLAGLPLVDGSSWTFRISTETPAGSWQSMSASSRAFGMQQHEAAWTGRNVIFYDGMSGIRYDVTADSWATMSTVNAPAPRNGASLTSIGDRVVVWGGYDPDFGAPDGGGIYNPASDSWQPIAPPVGSIESHMTGRTKMAVVWTGSEVIYWGGRDVGSSNPQSSGLRYDPATNNWRRFTGTNAPEARYGAKAVWTGKEMIVWGGFGRDGIPLADGARYSPATDSWSILPAIDLPIDSIGDVTMVWTGSEMILWNGGRTEAYQRENDRRRRVNLRIYDPESDTWRASASGWEPFLLSGFGEYIAHWTGTKLFVYGVGGRDGGYFYDLATDRWQPASTSDAIAFTIGSASVWAGDRVVIWGGFQGGFISSNLGRIFLP